MVNPLEDSQAEGKTNIVPTGVDNAEAIQASLAETTGAIASDKTASMQTLMSAGAKLPEALEKSIMLKVQDINHPGIGFHGTDHKSSLEDILKKGLFAAYRKNVRGSKEGTIDTDKWKDFSRQKNLASKMVVDFNITGRVMGPWEGQGLDVAQTRWTGNGAATVLFDLSGFTEIAPGRHRRLLKVLRGMQFTANEPCIEGYPVYKDPKSINHDDILASSAFMQRFNGSGQLKSSEEHGFITPRRIAPRHFRGLVFDNKVKKTEEELLHDALTRMSARQRDGGGREYNPVTKKFDGPPLPLEFYLDMERKNPG